MENLSFAKFVDVTHVTETSNTQYAEQLLELGWKIVTAGTRYCDGDNVPVLVFGWFSESDPQYPQESPAYKRLEPFHK